MVIVVTGPSGSGKSTVGKLLADALGWPFYEGDQFHPPENIERMKSGRPLGDAERAPWLSALARLIARHLAEGSSAVLACSALKRAYRAALLAEAPPEQRHGVRFVYLRADPRVLAERVPHRQGHFFPASLLNSQLADLEEPVAGEEVLVVDATLPPSEIVARIIEALGLKAAAGNR
jgi:gluconokinase